MSTCPRFAIFAGWFAWIAIVTAQAWAQAPSGQQDSSSCRKFAQEFYDWYLPLSHKSSQQTAWSLAAQRKPEVFSADLLKALKIDSDAAAHAKGDIVGLDFDPFLGGQDPASRYEARGVSWHGDKCSVEISPAAPRAAKPPKPDAVAELSLNGAHWQFQNFRYPDPPSDLLSVLAQLRAERRKH